MKNDYNFEKTDKENLKKDRIWLIAVAFISTLLFGVVLIIASFGPMQRIFKDLTSFEITIISEYNVDNFSKIKQEDLIQNIKKDKTGTTVLYLRSSLGGAPNQIAGKSLGLKEEDLSKIENKIKGNLTIYPEKDLYILKVGTKGKNTNFFVFNNEESFNNVIRDVSNLYIKPFTIKGLPQKNEETLRLALTGKDKKIIKALIGPKQEIVYETKIIQGGGWILMCLGYLFFMYSLTSKYAKKVTATYKKKEDKIKNNLIKDLESKAKRCEDLNVKNCLSTDEVKELVDVLKLLTFAKDKNE